MYTATKNAQGNYEVFFNGNRITTGSASILQNYGLSETQLSSGNQLNATGLGNSVANASTAPAPMDSLSYAQQQEQQKQAELARIEQNRKNGIIQQAQQISQSGGGTTAINNFYNSLSPADQPLVKSIFGNNIVPGYQAPTGNTQQTTVTPGGITTSTAGTVSTPTAPVAPEAAHLPPEFQQLYTQLETYLQQLQQRGQVLNPDVNITPQQTLAFLNQAQTEINPYYAGQLKLAKDSLSKSLDYSVGTENQSEQQAQKDYATNLRTLGESAADKGFAQSGMRVRDENNLASDTQTSIDQARRSLSYNAGNAASTFAQQYGSDNLPAPTMGNAPRVISGNSQFQTSGGSSPLYQLSPDVYSGLKGSQQYQQDADISNRASQLESAFRTTQGINQARTLTL